MNSAIEKIISLPPQVRECSMRSIVVRGDARSGKLQYTLLDTAFASTYADGTPTMKGMEPIREQKLFRYEGERLVEMPMDKEKVCSDF